MNTIKESFEKTIGYLDEENDRLLIALLRNKISNVGFQYSEEKFISDAEIRTEASRCFNMATREIEYELGYLKKYDKINKILANNNCNPCKYASIVVSYHNSGKSSGVYHIGHPNKTERCYRCTRRTNSLRRHISNLEDEVAAIIYELSKIDYYEEIVKTKVLVNKINNKLKKIKK